VYPHSSIWYGFDKDLSITIVREQSRTANNADIGVKNHHLESVILPSNFLRNWFFGRKISRLKSPTSSSNASPATHASPLQRKRL
jgi:hypothetical protein